MAEYIDKQKYREEWLKFKTFEPMICLDLIPIADVVEREKIDKAIEEIKADSFNEERTDIPIIELQDVLEILKRNIGE